MTHQTNTDQIRINQIYMDYADQTIDIGTQTQIDVALAVGTDKGRVVSAISFSN